MLRAVAVLCLLVGPAAATLYAPPSSDDYRRGQQLVEACIQATGEQKERICDNLLELWAECPSLEHGTTEAMCRGMDDAIKGVDYHSVNIHPVVPNQEPERLSGSQAGALLIAECRRGDDVACRYLWRMQKVCEKARGQDAYAQALCHAISP